MMPNNFKGATMPAYAMCWACKVCHYLHIGIVVRYWHSGLMHVSNRDATLYKHTPQTSYYMRLPRAMLHGRYWHNSDVSPCYKLLHAEFVCDKSYKSPHYNFDQLEIIYYTYLSPQSHQHNQYSFVHQHTLMQIC